MDGSADEGAAKVDACEGNPDYRPAPMHICSSHGATIRATDFHDPSDPGANTPLVRPTLSGDGAA
jgi:hypothetical protein